MNDWSDLVHSSGYQYIAPMWQYSLIMLMAILLAAPIMYSLLTNVVRLLEARMKKGQTE